MSDTHSPCSCEKAQLLAEHQTCGPSETSRPRPRTMERHHVGTSICWFPLKTALWPEKERESGITMGHIGQLFFPHMQNQQLPPTECGYILCRGKFIVCDAETCTSVCCQAASGRFTSRTYKRFTAKTLCSQQFPEKYKHSHTNKITRERGRRHRKKKTEWCLDLESTEDPDGKPRGFL